MCVDLTGMAALTEKIINMIESYMKGLNTLTISKIFWESFTLSNININSAVYTFNHDYMFFNWPLHYVDIVYQEQSQRHDN